MRALETCWSALKTFPCVSTIHSPSIEQPTSTAYTAAYIGVLQTHVCKAKVNAFVVLVQHMIVENLRTCVHEDHLRVWSMHPTTFIHIHIFM